MLKITEEDLKKIKRRAASRYVLNVKSTYLYSNAKKMDFEQYHAKFKMIYRDNVINFNLRLALYKKILKIYYRYVHDCLIDGRKVKFFFKNNTKGLGYLYVKIYKNRYIKSKEIVKDKVVLKWMKPRYRKTNPNRVNVDDYFIRPNIHFLGNAYKAYNTVVGLKKAIEKGNFFPITTNNYGYRRTMNNLPIVNSNKKTNFSTTEFTKEELDEYLEYERTLANKWVMKKFPLKVTDVTTGDVGYYRHIPHLASRFNVHAETISRYIKLKLFYLDKFLIEKYNKDECS